MKAREIIFEAVNLADFEAKFRAWIERVRTRLKSEADPAIRFNREIFSPETRELHDVTGELAGLLGEPLPEKPKLHPLRTLAKGEIVGPPVNIHAIRIAPICSSLPLETYELCAIAMAMGNALTGGDKKPNFIICPWGTERLIKATRDQLGYVAPDGIMPTKDQFKKFSAVYPIMQKVAGEITNTHRAGAGIPIHLSMPAVVKSALKNGGSFEPRTPRAAASHAMRVVRRRTPEYEPLILKDVVAALSYASHFEFKWPALIEKLIRWLNHGQSEYNVYMANEYLRKYAR